MKFMDFKPMSRPPFAISARLAGGWLPLRTGWKYTWSSGGHFPEWLCGGEI